MDSKWTLKHNKHHCIIVNQGGKNIGYQPNAGVQIMEADGYGSVSYTHLTLPTNSRV